MASIPPAPTKVLVVDDEPGLRQVLDITFRRQGIDVLTAAKQRSEATEVIVMTAHSTLEAAIEAMRRGAYDFVSKPFSPAEIAALAGKALEKSSIVSENQRLRAQL